MSVLPKSSMKASRIRDSTTYLGKLFQWWVVLAVNNFFLNSIWNLSQCKYHSLMQSPCVYLGGKLPFSLYPPFKNRNPGMWSPWAISSPGRGDKSPSAFPQGRFLSPLITFITFFDFLQSFYIFLDLWGPELHAIIQLPNSWEDWDDPVSVSSNVPMDAAQDLIYLGCCSGALLANT